MYTFSIPVGVLLLLSLLLAIFYFKNFRIRLLFFAIVPTLFWELFIPAMSRKDIFLPPFRRYLFSLLIFILILLINSLSSEETKISSCHLFLCHSYVCGKTVSDLVRLPRYTCMVGAYIFRTPLFNQSDYKDLWFEYDTSKWRKLFLPISGKTL